MAIMKNNHEIRKERMQEKNRRDLDTLTAFVRC